MRGTPILAMLCHMTTRIIPAHAGNSMSRRWIMSAKTDHPRACGELGGKRLPIRSGLGSSPRMRGTPNRTNSPPSSLADHPRACGELVSFADLVRELLGSSPRMRGTPYTAMVVDATLRIIPAHAGNSTSPSVPSPSTPDHPRACGELGGPGASPSADVGSSPRMRGTLRKRPRDRIGHRIIPAHAGNSSPYR